MITKEKLVDLYTNQKYTDADIAKQYNLDRTSIVRLRQKFDIQPNNSLLEQSLTTVITKLESLGYHCLNLKLKDKTASCDLLVNNKIKVEVTAASNLNGDGTFKFSFTYPENKNYIESDFRIQLPNKKFKKLYRLTCDYIICIGNHNSEIFYWIVPSNDLPDTLQTLSLTPYAKKSKYKKYENAWNLLK